MLMYVSRPWSACYEGNDSNAGVGAGTGGNSGVGGNPGAAGGDPPKMFSQEEVNRIVAADRRKLEEALKKTEQQYQDLLKSQSLTEQERKALQENLSAVQGQLRSKEEQLALEKKQVEESYASRLQELEKKAAFFETLYRDSTIERALTDAAAKHDAWSALQIVVQLRNQTKMLEETDPKTGKLTGKFRPMVEMQTVNPTTGEMESKSYTPDDAVKKMKEMPEQFGNLFRPNVVSGIGAGTATGGLMPGQRGKIDLRNMTQEQYLELRAKNPELLGLRKHR